MNKNSNEFQSLLKNIDFSENEIAVYISALQLGNALVKDIAKQAKLNRTTTYNLLLGLRKMGLVSSYQKKGIMYFSAAPPSHIKDILDERNRRNEAYKHKLETLLPAVQALYNSANQSSTVKMYEGLDSLPNIYRSVYQNARYPAEGLEFTNWGGKYDLFPEQLRQELIQLLRKNDIFVRSLLIEDDLTRTWKEKEQKENQQKRIQLLPNPHWDFFCNLELCENRLAIVTYRNDDEFQGLLIESTELSTMFRFMFEAMWSKE